MYNLVNQTSINSMSYTETCDAFSYIYLIFRLHVDVVHFTSCVLQTFSSTYEFFSSNNIFLRNQVTRNEKSSTSGRWNFSHMAVWHFIIASATLATIDEPRLPCRTCFWLKLFHAVFSFHAFYFCLPSSFKAKEI